MTIDPAWLSKDYYAVLAVSQEATAKEIKTSYRKLARQYHPDTNPGNAEAEQKFKEVSEAYGILGDEDKRKAYDQAQSLNRQPSFSDVYPNFDFQGNMPMENLFEDFFATPRRSTMGFGYSQGASIPTKGRSYQASTKISFEEALKGVTVKFATTAGEEILAPIPALVEDGDVVTLPGKGGPGTNGGASGDLLVQVTVEPHKWFKRQGPDLQIDVPVTFDELALGGIIEVPTLEGKLVKVRIPSGTPNGKTFKVKNYGLPNSEGEAGALLVTMKVEIPKTLPPEAIKALESYRKATEIHTPRTIFQAIAE